MIRFYGWDDGLHMSCDVCDGDERIAGDGADPIAFHTLVELAFAHAGLHSESFGGNDG